MSDWRFPQHDGHTPLSEEDRRGLLLSHIATRDDLNDAEQRNIAKTLGRRPPTAERLLDDMYLRSLHKYMFGAVWEWAGRYRQRVTNIGVAPAQIAADLRMLTDDAKEWVSSQYQMSACSAPAEYGTSSHHRASKR